MASGSSLETIWSAKGVRLTPRQSPLSGCYVSWSHQIDAASVRVGILVFSALLAGNPGSDARLWIRANGAAGEIATESLDVKVEGSEARHNITIRIPSMAKRISFGLFVRGGAEVNASEVSLRLIGWAPMSPSPFDFFESAIRTIRLNAWNASDVDWTEFVRSAATDLRRAKASVDVYPIIRAAITALNDNHSHFVTPEMAARYRTSGVSLGDITISKVADGVGYISIPGFAGIDETAAFNFADQIATALLDIKSDATRGCVIDLRYNRGGNMWPMLAGLDNILDRGEIGYFELRDGQRLSWRDHLKTLFPIMKGNYYPIRPMAVLLSNLTSSAGEALAVALRGQPKTCCFGHKTAGRANSNSAFTLQDESQLIVKTAVLVDRLGRTYGDHVIPDHPSSETFNTEEALWDAASWIMTY